MAKMVDLGKSPGRIEAPRAPKRKYYPDLYGLPTERIAALRDAEVGQVFRGNVELRVASMSQHAGEPKSVGVELRKIGDVQPKEGPLAKVLGGKD